MRFIVNWVSFPRTGRNLSSVGVSSHSKRDLIRSFNHLSFSEGEGHGPVNGVRITWSSRTGSSGSNSSGESHSSSSSTKGESRVEDWVAINSWTSSSGCRKIRSQSSLKSNWSSRTGSRHASRNGHTISSTSRKSTIHSTDT